MHPYTRGHSLAPSVKDIARNSNKCGISNILHVLAVITSRAFMSNQHLTGLCDLCIILVHASIFCPDKIGQQQALQALRREKAEIIGTTIFFTEVTSVFASTRIPSLEENKAV